MTDWDDTKFSPMCFDLSTARQKWRLAGVLTDQLCRAIYCIHASIMHMQIAITIT